MISQSFPLPEPVLDLLPHLPSDETVWLVGGAVRDVLLGRLTDDFDFVVDGDALRLTRRLASEFGGNVFTLDRERGTGRLILETADGTQATFDFTRLHAANIEADLESRDFTINAMAVNLHDSSQRLDPTGGLKDLKDQILRACGPRSVSDDPIRSLRAIRIAVELNFQVASKTQKQLKAAASSLNEVSAERVRDELFRIFGLPRPGVAIRLLNHLGLLYAVFPELESLEGLDQPQPYALKAMEHTLVVVDRMGDLLALLGPTHDPEAAADLTLAQVSLRLGRYRDQLESHLNRTLSYGRSARQVLYLASLLFSSGKPIVRRITGDNRIQFPDYETASADVTEARAKALRLSNLEIHHLAMVLKTQKCLETFQTAHSLTPQTIYRFFRQDIETGVDAVLLWLADFLGTYTPSPPQDVWSDRVEAARILLEAFFDSRETLIDPPTLVDGNDLKRELDLESGPEIGRLLEIVREGQVVGEVQTAEQALSLARQAAEIETPRKDSGALEGDITHPDG